MALVLIRGENNSKILNAIADVERHAKLNLSTKPKKIDAKYADKIVENILKAPLRTKSKVATAFRIKEDTATAIVQTSDMKLAGFQVFNVGTGEGTSVQQVIQIIEDKLCRKFVIEHVPQKTSGVNGIVLDCEKIKNVSGWERKIDINTGIEMTIQAKKSVLRIQ